MGLDDVLRGLGSARADPVTRGPASFSRGRGAEGGHALPPTSSGVTKEDLGLPRGGSEVRKGDRSLLRGGSGATKEDLGLPCGGSGVKQGDRSLLRGGGGVKKGDRSLLRGGGGVKKGALGLPRGGSGLNREALDLPVPSQPLAVDAAVARGFVDVCPRRLLPVPAPLPVPGSPVIKMGSDVRASVSASRRKRAMLGELPNS